MSSRQAPTSESVLIEPSGARLSKNSRMTELLLKRPEPIAGIINLYSVNSKGVLESVRADTVHSPRLRIGWPGQANFFAYSSAIYHALYLWMPKSSFLPPWFIAPLNVFPKKSQGIAVNRQCPHPGVVLLPGYDLFHTRSTLWAESMTLAQPRPGFESAKPDTRLEVLDGHRSVDKIDAIYLKSQNLIDFAADSCQQPEEEPVPHKDGGVFGPLNLTHFKIGFHRLSAPLRVLPVWHGSF